MTREKELAEALKRKIKPGAFHIQIGRIMAREIIKCLEGASECQSGETRKTD